MVEYNAGIVEPEFHDSTAAERFTCPICRGVVQDAVRCPNGHLFCCMCLNTWKDAQPTLPDDNDEDDEDDEGDANEVSVYVKFRNAATVGDVQQGPIGNDTVEESDVATTRETESPLVKHVTSLAEWKTANDRITFSQYVKRIEQRGFFTQEPDGESASDSEHLQQNPVAAPFKYEVHCSSTVLAEVLQVNAATVRRCFDVVTTRAAEILGESATIAEMSKRVANGRRAGDPAFVRWCMAIYRTEYSRLSDSGTATVRETLTKLDAVVDDIGKYASLTETMYVGGRSMTRVLNGFLDLLEMTSEAQWYIVRRQSSAAAEHMVHDEVAGNDDNQGQGDAENDVNDAVSNPDGSVSDEASTITIRKQIEERILDLFYDVRDRARQFRQGKRDMSSINLVSDTETGGELVDSKLVQMAIGDVRRKLEQPLLEGSEVEATAKFMARRALAAAAELKTLLKQTGEAIDAVDDAVRDFCNAVDGYLTDNAATTISAHKMAQKTMEKARKTHEVSAAFSGQVRSAEAAAQRVESSVNESRVVVEKENMVAIPIFLSEDEQEDIIKSTSVCCTCPVCRRMSDFNRCPDTDRALSEQSVDCPFVDLVAGNCRWTGRYADYLSHMHRYEDDTQPASAETDATDISRVRQAPKRRYEDGEDDEPGQSPDKKRRT